MRCGDCLNWIVERRDQYADGTSMSRYAAPAGKGECGILGTETEAEFGCVKYALAPLAEQHVVTQLKIGAPWDHWQMGPCPQCNKAGNNQDAACHRCTGTGQVRHYDDGYVGEEQTREHPRQKEVRLLQVREAALARARAEVAAAELMPEPVVPEQAPIA